MRPMCIGVLFVAMLFPPSLFAQEDTLRVFFLGRSEFGTSGGIPAPFEEVCELAGMRCRAHRHWDFIENDRRNGLPIRSSAVARNPHVLRILATQEFDAIFYSFFAYNTEFFEPEPEYTADVLDGYEALYRLITVAGAQPYINIGYATLDNPGDTGRITLGTALLMARLDSVAMAARTPPPILVPGGNFFNDMARQLAESRWFADPLHASELGQYAMARFFFSCITGRDPTTFAHPDRIDPQDARRIDAGIVQQMATCGAQSRPSWSRRPATTDRIRVFVRGDDFGYTESSNRALERASRAGVLRSASLLLTGPLVAGAAAVLEERPDVSIGVHLAVTSEWDQLRWAPVGPAHQVPSLVAADGAMFKNYRGADPAVLDRLARMPAEERARMRAILGTVAPDPAQVELELRAQIERARALGLRVDYLDCHMGIVCEGRLRPVLIQLSEELCLPIPEQGWMGHEEIGSQWSGTPEDDLAALDTLLRSLSPGLYRIVLHPAEDSAESRAVDSISGVDEALRRDSQLRAIESPRIQRAIEEAGIELVSVRDLWDYQNCRLR